MTSSIITTNELSKSFGDLKAVNNLTINVPRGKVFGFLGPNGAGKTTSLKMMVGLLNPTSGTVTINDIDPTKGNHSIKQRLGMIPQDIVLWKDLTVQENLEYIASLYRLSEDESKQTVERLIKEIHLEDKRNELAKNLSGGLKRRLNIIMGLVHNPEIVVCDEPTPGLDPQSRTLVWQFIRDLSKKKGKTVILTTHFMEEADRLSDIVAIMDHGKLLVVDTPDNLKQSIGEGDLVEIHLNNDEYLDEALNKLQDYEVIEEVKLVNDYIQIRCLNAPSKLAGIFNRIELITGLEVKDVKIRNATLEDVFIHLTGRELRE